MPKATDRLVQAWLLFVRSIPQLWTGSKVSGYAEGGPYHCGDCKYAKGRKEGMPWRDGQGRGRCGHPVIEQDSAVRVDEQGRKIINLEHGCCEFVDDSGITPMQEIFHIW